LQSLLQQGGTLPTITQERIGEFVKTAFQILAENDGRLPSRDVIRFAEPRLHLNDHEREQLPSGVVRWQNALHWYTVDSVKAGWLIKRNGVWYLTDEGRKAISLDPLTFFKTAGQKYEEAIAARRVSAPAIIHEKSGVVVGVAIGEEAISRATATALENAESMARSEIEDYIDSLGPYEFQDLVAALLRGMGYFTPFVAPRGKDGGLDILAYRDPLGSTAPRLKVQVKHREDKVKVGEVRELVSLLTRDGDAGLIVSSGGFTSDAESEIRRAPRHVEKIDLNDLIQMWDDHYDQMQEEDRRLMPLKRVAFLAPKRN
jgi:restriction system protein